MEPFVRNGSPVRIVRCSPDAIRPGHIIAYRGSDTMITIHRVFAIEGSGENRIFITKGDSRRCFDLPVPSQTLVGLVHAVHARSFPSTAKRALELLYINSIVPVANYLRRRYSSPPMRAVRKIMKMALSSRFYVQPTLQILRRLMKRR